MNCRQIESLLSDYLEGALKARDQGAFLAHLRDCPACRRRRDQVIALEEKISETIQWQPGSFPGFRRRAMERWRAAREAPAAAKRRLSPLPPPSPALRLSLLGAAAMAIVAALLSLAGWQHDRPRRISPPQVVRREKPIQHLIPLPGVRQPGAPSPTRQTGLPGPARQPAPDWNAPHPRFRGTPKVGRRAPALLTPRPAVDDLTAINADPEAHLRQWVNVPKGQWEKIEARVRAVVRVRDDFVTIPFPRLASTSNRQIAEAVTSYKREAAIVDPRLSREVNLQFKGTALSDVCSQLRGDTGIELAAGPSVADEKITVFCEKLPLRDVMRQLSRPFGYTWLRSKKEGGEYRYELVQDLRSQLLEEELRNRDRDQALIALDREMEGYQPYLALSPDEAQARARTAAPETKKLLEALAGPGWGPIHMYFRLSPQELAALRAGGTITFSADPKPGEQPLPPDVARTVLQSLREGLAAANMYAMATEAGAGPHQVQSTLRVSPGGGPPSPDDPDAQAQVSLSLSRSELGRFTLGGLSGVVTSGGMMMRGAGPYAVGTSPAATQPDNSAVNAQLATDPALRRRISVQPKPHCWEPAFSGPGELQPFAAFAAAGPGPQEAAPSDAGGRPLEVIGGGPAPKEAAPGVIGGGPGPLEAAPGGAEEPPQSKIQNPKSKIGKVNSADVLEALHMATGLPVVADFHTHLYSPEAVSVTNQPIFEALNQLAGAMKLRWDKQGKWLQFRTASFYNDRLKEVPNRLLSHWSAARPKSGWLPLAQLLEMARCSDAQMDAADMAEGTRVCWGLPEWDLVRVAPGRPQLRFLAGFSEPQLREAMSPAGLAFTRMSLAQQQQFLALGMGPNANPSLDELAGASLHVEYLQPGAFRWTPTESAEPAGSGPRAKTFGARGPGRSGAPSSGVRLLESQALQGSNAWRWLPGLSPVMAPTRQAALLAARRLDPQAQPSQIMPTDLAVTLVYVWGSPKTGGMASTHRLAASQTGLGAMQTRQPLPPIGGSEPAAAPR
jgi:anti-sigma factor RsiW